MLKLLPQGNTLMPNSANPREVVEFINSYIDKYHCEYMSVDISAMNILDACHVSTTCSTRHYIKYPEGKINWKISSELVKNLCKDLELGNASYTV